MADSKKQVPLRLSPKLYDAIAAWAEDDFRSVNGQIEYLLTECVRQRRKNGNMSRMNWMFRRSWICNKLPESSRFLTTIPRRIITDVYRVGMLFSGRSFFCLFILFLGAIPSISFCINHSVFSE